MRLASRVFLTFCALLAIAIPPAGADLIFLKDGYVVQGTVRREVTAELDPVSREMTLIPKGFFMIDDGPRRIYFAPSQVRIVEKLANPAEERVLSRSGRLIVNPRPLPPHLEVVEVGKWDLKRWEREYAFRSPGYGRVGVIQGLATLSPYFARVDAVTKFRWSAAYLTREWEPGEVLQLLKSNPSLMEADKDKPAEAVAKRLRIGDFLAQAGWYDLAQKELTGVLETFPDQKERVESARTLLDKLRNREDWEQVKNWYHAGRHEAVRKRLESFQSRTLTDRIQADLRDMRSRLAGEADQITETTRALEQTLREATSPVGKALGSAVTVLLTELHPATVARLDAFQGQYREAQRQLTRGSKSTVSPEQLLALAVSGWLLGSPSAEARPDTAVNLWKTRQMVLEYLQETDLAARKRILAEYQKNVTPPVELDEIAQMIDHLPPVEPARERSTEVIECKAGSGRNPSTYFLQLPPEYTHNRQYPVLVLLPEAGMTPRQILSRFEKLAADHGYILAAAQWARGLADEYAYTEREHDSVLDTIRDLRRRYQIDSDRVFLFGQGEGGKAAFDIGLAHPDLFAGVIPMAAGPNLFAKRCWRNAQYLPFYVVNGTRGSDSQTLLREQFNNWILRGYPALWVEYKGRGTEFFSGELPFIFDWMRLQRRVFPLRQLGTDGNGTIFGNEFCTMRPEDNRFYWLSAPHISPRNLVDPLRWNNLASPAALTGRIDPAAAEINLKTQGINELSLWFGRNPVGQYMIDFEKPQTIRVGLKTVFTGKITPALGVLLEDLYQRGDRKHLFLARLDFNLR
ncbi:MAG: hypothetical protein U0840_15055 [Gemmataceae bacterium]